VKRKFVILLLLLILGATALPLWAQQADRLDQLVVDIWPDFDQPEVLVLLTGRLPAGSALPVELAIPVPPEATLHAVAVISSDNQMFETPYTYEDGQVLFSAPEQRFRVEYYLPYEADGMARSFTFTYQSPLAIDDLNVSIQQPAAATSMTVEPPAEVVGQATDGLTYHDFVSALAANQAFSLDIAYEMGSAQLTASATAAPPAPAAVPAEEGAAGLTMNWPLFLGGAGLLFIVLALIWHFWGNRAPARPPRKPAVRRAALPARGGSQPGSPARFCHNCGAQAEAGDRFCRECGTELRR
jgi:hypothetical protein